MTKNEIILDALRNALTLLNEEHETVINAELIGKYEQTIDKIEDAIKIMSNKKK
jgi:hypothetical protein